jgi:hypothetical protein
MKARIKAFDTMAAEVLASSQPWHIQPMMWHGPDHNDVSVCCAAVLRSEL